MYDFDVRIGKNWHPSKNPTCTSNQPLQKGETRAIFCSRPIRGNNVGMVQKMDDNFDFCEVSVHGRDVGWITGNRAPGTRVKTKKLFQIGKQVVASLLTCSH